MIDICTATAARSRRTWPRVLSAGTASGCLGVKRDPRAFEDPPAAGCVPVPVVNRRGGGRGAGGVRLRRVGSRRATPSSTSVFHLSPRGEAVPEGRRALPHGFWGDELGVAVITTPGPGRVITTTMAHLRPFGGSAQPDHEMSQFTLGIESDSEIRLIFWRSTRITVRSRLSTVDNNATNIHVRRCIGRTARRN